MGNRIKGQDVEILMIINGVPQSTFTSIRDFEVEPQLEIQSEGYLGETTDRKDNIFNGVRGRFGFHPDTHDILKVVGQLIAKARRRTPGLKINIKATLNFPNGQRPRVIIPDCEFGGVPLNIGSRKDYVNSTFSFEASEMSVLY